MHIDHTCTEESVIDLRKHTHVVINPFISTVCYECHYNDNMVLKIVGFFAHLSYFSLYPSTFLSPIA